jgi:hypothetical protein
MISLKVLQIALSALILLFIILLITDVFASPGTGWMEGFLLGMIVALGGWVGFRRKALHASRTKTVKRTRDSILKWRWEDRHKREW